MNNESGLLRLTDKELHYFVSEIVLQANAVRNAILTLNAALPKNDSQRVMTSAQGAINAAMAINRLLWVNLATKDHMTEKEKEMRAWRLSRAKQLRKVAGNINAEKSPLAYRKVRNAFEHLEEYLDEFLFDIRRGTRPPITADMNMGAKTAFILNGEPMVHLRFFDFHANEVSVLDRTLNLQELVDEVNRVDRLARKWLQEHRLRTYGPYVAQYLEDLDGE